MATGTLITVYYGYEIREAAQHTTGISLGVNIYHAGEFIGYEKNVAQAKSRIDVAVVKAKREAPQPAPAKTEAATETATETAEQRKARNAKLMGRYENNPDDLI